MFLIQGESSMLFFWQEQCSRCTFLFPEFWAFLALTVNSKGYVNSIATHFPYLHILQANGACPGLMLPWCVAYLLDWWHPQWNQLEITMHVPGCLVPHHRQSMPSTEVNAKSLGCTSPLIIHPNLSHRNILESINKLLPLKQCKWSGMTKIQTSTICTPTKYPYKTKRKLDIFCNAKIQ